MRAIKGIAVLDCPRGRTEGRTEVAQLKLNAGWVVLSACNTIAGDKPGAEALWGLARAFSMPARVRCWYRSGL